MTAARSIVRAADALDHAPSGGPVQARPAAPSRRQKLIDAAIDCVAARGVAGTTHRQIAAIADVPLGSTTYYFATLDDLLLAAFEQVARRMSEHFDQTIAVVSSRDELVEALVRVVHQDLQQVPRDQVLTYELYALAARRPAFKIITQQWMARTRSTLRQHLPTETAYAVDAYLEGAAVHVAMDPDPRPAALTRFFLKALIAEGVASSR